MSTPIQLAEEKFGATAIERFYEKATPSKRYSFEGTPCLIWRRAKSRGGLRQWEQKNYYGAFSVRLPIAGQFRTPGRRFAPSTGMGEFIYKAHRFAWEVVMGPIPPRMEPHHRCTRTLCINTAHMQLLTGAENVAERNRRVAAARAARNKRRT